MTRSEQVPLVGLLNTAQHHATLFFLVEGLAKGMKHKVFIQFRGTQQLFVDDKIPHHFWAMLAGRITVGACVDAPARHVHHLTTMRLGGHDVRQ